MYLYFSWKKFSSWQNKTCANSFNFNSQDFEELFCFEGFLRLTCGGCRGISHTLSSPLANICPQREHTWRTVFCGWLVRLKTQRLTGMLAAPTCQALGSEQINKQYWFPPLQSSVFHCQNSSINVIMNHAIRLIPGGNAKPARIQFLPPPQRLLAVPEHMALSSWLLTPCTWELRFPLPFPWRPRFLTFHKQISR